MTTPYKILAAVLIVLAAFVAGVAVGWKFESGGQAKQAVKAAQADVSAIQAEVTKQNAAVSEQLQVQQDKSAALDAQQAVVRGNAANINLEIQYAVYTPSDVTASCADPVDSDEFVRLYGRAAAAGSGPAAASSSAAR